MSVFIDKQSGSWKLKTVAGGRDKRITLRKALPGETTAIKPPDVLSLAERHGHKPTVPPATTSPTPDPTSLLKWIEWFDKDYQANHREGSCVRMERILRLFRQFVGDKDRSLASVDYAFMKAFFDYRMASKVVSGRTVVSEFKVLQGLFKQAIRRDFLGKNPCRNLMSEVKKAYPDTDEIKYLDTQEIASLLAAIDTAVANGMLHIDFADCAKIMLNSGMRIGAACHLDWSWINRHTWRIAIPPSTDLIPTKTKVGYIAVVAEAGREVLIRRQQDGTIGRVFPPRLTANSVYCQLKRKFGVNPHQLRHSFATTLVNNTIPIQTIGDLIGDRGLKSVQRYARISDKAKDAAVATLRF